MGHALPLDTSNDKWWYNQTLNFVYDLSGGLRADNTKGFLRRNYQGRTSDNPFTWEIFCNNEVAEMITNAGIINPNSPAGRNHEFAQAYDYQNLFGDFLFETRILSSLLRSW